MDGQVMRKLQLLLSCLISLLVLVTGGAGVAGQDQDEGREAPGRAIAFYPEATGEGTYVTLELKPGETGTFRVVLGNAGQIVQTLRTYAVPAESGIHGGFTLTPYGTLPDKQTSWLDFPEQEFTFDPGKGIVLDVTVEVPSTTSPGEYVTGLAAEQSEPFEIEGTELITQRVRWALPVLIVVPGERLPAFELGDARLEDRNGLLIANVDIVNTGNVTVRPVGQARLRDEHGDVVGVSTIEMNSVYSGTDTYLIVAWEGVPESPTYSIQIELSAENSLVSVEHLYEGLEPQTLGETNAATPVVVPLGFAFATLDPLTNDTPPSMLQLTAEIANNAEPIENARVSMVTYQDGVEIDRYPILQGVTINQGTTPVQARYALPGGFTKGTYTFVVTIEIGSADTQTILATQKLDYEITVP